jgi:hypothetical protein
MNKELQNKLKKYSAAAVAIAATGTAADAQIVYTQVNKTINAPTASGFAVDSIDINAAGGHDLAMVLYNIPSYNLNIVIGGPLGSQGHALAGSAPSSYNYPFKLNSGQQINTQAFLPADSFGTFTWVDNGTNPYSSFWNGGVTDGYLGLKLQVGGGTHYGWVRMDISSNGKTVVIKDMAYNATPNGGISAGQGMSIDVYESLANSVWIAENRLHTDLQVEFANASVSVVDITGKEVAKFEVTEQRSTFNLGDLAKGTYVISLVIDGDTINKKAVVQ